MLNLKDLEASKKLQKSSATLTWHLFLCSMHGVPRIPSGVSIRDLVFRAYTLVTMGPSNLSASPQSSFCPHVRDLESCHLRKKGTRRTSTRTTILKSPTLGPGHAYLSVPQDFDVVMTRCRRPSTSTSKRPSSGFCLTSSVISICFDLLGIHYRP